MSGEIGQRLARALKKRTHVRNVDLARALGVTPQRLQGWLGRYDPPPAYYSRIAEELNISIDWLLGEPVPMDALPVQMRPVSKASTRFIPVYGENSTSNPALGEETIVSWLELKDWGTDTKRWGRMNLGYSMEPFLEDLDIAIFEEMEPAPGHVVHATNGSADTIQVFRVIDGVTMLWPTNNAYKPIAASGWQIKGVCIGYFRNESDGSTTERIYSRGMRPKVFS